MEQEVRSASSQVPPSAVSFPPGEDRSCPRNILPREASAPPSWLSGRPPPLISEALRPRLREELEVPRVPESWGHPSFERFTVHKCSRAPGGPTVRPPRCPSCPTQGILLEFWGTGCWKVGRPGVGCLTEPLSSFIHKFTLETGLWVREPSWGGRGVKFIPGEMSRRQASQVCVLVGGCNNSLLSVYHVLSTSLTQDLILTSW